MTLTAPTANALTYTGEAHALVAAGTASVGEVVYSLAETGTYTRAIPTGTDAGDYAVWYKVNASSNYNVPAPAKVDVKINKASYTGAKAADLSVRYGTEGTYDLADMLPAGYALGTVATSDGNGIFEGAVTLDGTKLAYTLADDKNKAGKTGVITIPVTSAANYNGFEITVTVTVDDKIPVTITGVTGQNGTYTAAGQTGYIGTPASEYKGKYAITYSGRNGTAYNSETPPANAGDYTVTIAVPENDKTYTGSITLDFSIAKAKVVVTAKSKTVDVGSDAPDFSNPQLDVDYTVSGLLGDDTLIVPPTLSCSPDMSAAGAYVITLSGADAGSNYAIEYGNGTLFVKAVDVETQLRVDREELSEVPSGIKGKFPTVAALKEELTKTLISQSGYTAGSTAHYDVTLQFSLDGGVTWVPAEEDNFPAEGITIVIPYPAGTGMDTHDFVVSHIFTTTSAKLGTAAGDVETPEVIKLASGIQVTLKGLSPVAVVWKSLSSSPEPTETASPEPTGTASPEPIGTASPEPTGTASPEPTGTASPEPTGTASPEPTGTASPEPTGTASPEPTGTASPEPIGTASPEPTGTASPEPTKTPSPSPSPTPWRNPFQDVPETGWYLKAVEFVSERGLMCGYANGKFGPNDTLTRAEFAQIIYNKEGRPSTGSSKFTDVKPGEWYANAVNWAAANGVVNGIGNDKFAPNVPITREQLATMLWRYAGSPEPAKTTLNFTDASKVSDYTKKAMLWANENGIVNGKGNGILDPKGKATRAEAAQMLMNYLKK